MSASTAFLSASGLASIKIQSDSRIFAVMKRNQFLLGFVISLGMAMLASIPLIRGFGDFESFAWSDILLRGVYSFLSSMFLWFGILWAIHDKAFSNFVKNGALRGMLIIFVAALLTNIVCDYLLPKLSGKLNLIAEFLRIKRPLFLFSKCLFQGMMYYAIILIQKTTEEKRQNQLEIQELKQARLEANILSLKEQLSPHFLFNTLNTLSTLTAEKQAQDFIQEMAKVYRYVLQYKEKNVATLREELQFLSSYWYILKARFENSVSLSVDIPEELLDSSVPPLTLQMLIENVIKHNTANEEKPLAVRIYSAEKVIVVENVHRPKLNPQDVNGSGLKNIRQRYKLLFGQEIEIHKDSRLFQVKLPVIS
jgi:sensor histidine kinase YesM